MTAAALERDWEVETPWVPRPALERARRILPAWSRPLPEPRNKWELLLKQVAGMPACDNFGSRLTWWWRMGASFSQRVAMETLGIDGKRQ